MLSALLLLILLGLVAFPTAVTVWALIEADRIGALDTGERDRDGPAQRGRGREP